MDIYDQVTSEDIDYSEIGQSLPDPFYDSIENHVLIGVANIFLAPLFLSFSLQFLLSSWLPLRDVFWALFQGECPCLRVCKESVVASRNANKFLRARNLLISA